MIEINYRKPLNPEREDYIKSCVCECGGKITYREDNGEKSICLTAEFNAWENAIRVAGKLRDSGMYVEGPMDYGVD
jgi:hypothetical protein